MDITFPVDRIVLAVFGAGTPGEVYYFDCSLISGLYQWFHISSRVTKRRKNSFGLHLNSVKHYSDPDIFIMSNISCRICPAQSFKIPIASAITWVWLIKIRFASMLKLMKQMLLIAIEGKESRLQHTSSKRSLNLLHDFPSKNKNGISDRY